MKLNYNMRFLWFMSILLSSCYNESSCNNGKQVSAWNNKFYVVAREHIRQNIDYFVVKGVDQCNREDYEDSFDTFVKTVPANEEKAVLGEIQHGISVNTDTVFFGKDELLLMLPNPYVKFVLLDRQRPIAVDLYRNPYTGRRHIVLRDSVQNRPMKLVGDSMYNEFYFHSCEPLQSFMRRRYSKTLPTPITCTQQIHNRSFLKYFGSIGGISKQSVLLYNAKHQRPHTDPVSSKLRITVFQTTNATDINTVIPNDVITLYKNVAKGNAPG